MTGRHDSCIVFSIQKPDHFIVLAWERFDHEAEIQESLVQLRTNLIGCGGDELKGNLRMQVTKFLHVCTQPQDALEFPGTDCDRSLDVITSADEFLPCLVRKFNDLTGPAAEQKSLWGQGDVP